jgi:hypothetical protein
MPSVGIAAMPGALERDSPRVRSGSSITTSSAGDPPSHSPIFPGYKNSDRIVRGVMLECGPMRWEVPDVVSDVPSGMEADPTV